MLEPGGARLPRQFDRRPQIIGDRLLAIDVLAGVERAADELGTHQRRAGIEEDLVVRIGKRRVEIGRPAGNIMALGQLLHLVAIAADDDRIDLQPFARLERDPGPITDGQDRTHQVLVVSHAAGDTVQYYTQTRHAVPP